jgi:hypothetical protein
VWSHQGIRHDQRVDSNNFVPYPLAFTLGPLLLLVAALLLPARIREARRRLPVGRLSSATLNHAFDAWFPTLWAALLGLFGAFFVLSGLGQLAADYLH